MGETEFALLGHMLGTGGVFDVPILWHQRLVQIRADGISRALGAELTRDLHDLVCRWVAWEPAVYLRDTENSDHTFCFPIVVWTIDRPTVRSMCRIEPSSAKGGRPCFDSGPKSLFGIAPRWAEAKKAKPRRIQEGLGGYLFLALDEIFERAAQEKSRSFDALKDVLGIDDGGPRPHQLRRLQATISGEFGYKIMRAQGASQWKAGSRNDRFFGVGERQSTRRVKASGLVRGESTADRINIAFTLETDQKPRDNSSNLRHSPSDVTSHQADRKAASR